MNRAPRTVLLICSAGASGACGDEVTENVIGDALLASASELVGDNCEFGGTALSVGIDINADAELTDTEVDSSSYVCDAVSGSVAGTTVLTADESAGTSCPEGGISQTTGVDADGDGALPETEVVNVSHVCGVASNGSGTFSQSGDDEPGANCTDGGVRIDSGVDPDGDGVLAGAEIADTADACFPAAGWSTVLSVQEYLGRETQACPGGSIANYVGVDIDNGGDLQDDERSVSIIICS
ncbi:MAG: hypothetical protein ACJAYU_002623 [Bradymonadia bacterium]|jgi:hypothetical protein